MNESFHRRLAEMEARFTPRQIGCVVHSFMNPLPGRYQRVIQDWPCTRDKSKITGAECSHWADWELIPGMEAPTPEELFTAALEGYDEE